MERRRWLWSWLSRGIGSWLAIVTVALAFTGQTFAQGEPGESTETFTPDNLLSALPDVLSEGTLQPKARLWFSDRNGNMVLAPEEFAEDYFSSRGKSAAGGGSNGSNLPAAGLERVELDVSVEGDVAQIVGRFTARLSNDYATSISLVLGSVQWSQWSFSGEPQQNRLQPVREDPGWRWIVQAQPDTPSTATLQGVTRIARELDRRQLLLQLPTAPCIVRVKLPANAVDVRVRSEDVMQRKTIDGVEQLEITSSGGEFSLSWRDQEQLAQAAAVHATSNTKFEIVDPAQPWLATTELNIRWYGRDASHQIRLALPPGGRWIGLPASDFERYRISSDHAEVGDAAASAADTLETLPLLLENFDVVRNDTLKIVLEWEWTPGAQTTETLETEVHVAAPMAIGVDQHTGTIDCIATSAYAVVFQEGAGAQLIHQGPLLDAFARQQLQFKFDRQPFDLTLLFRREQSLPTVRPTYLVHVDRNKLTLTMWLDCSFDTNQPQMELGLILDEWVIQENTARMVNSPDDLFSSTGEILRVQQQVDRNYMIRSAKGDAASFGASRHIDQIWRVVAERTWNADDKELYFQVPQIIRGQVNGNPEIDHGSGALLVTSDSNVLLNWQESAGTGLQRDSFSTEYRRFAPNPGVRKPLVYRFQSSETTPQWAGRTELLARQVSVEQHVQLEVASTTVSVRQDFEMQVANEALEQLRFAVRKDAADSHPPQVFVNGLLVSASPVATIDEQTLIEMQLPPKPTEPPPTEINASESDTTEPGTTDADSGNGAAVQADAPQSEERPPRPASQAAAPLMPAAAKEASDGVAKATAPDPAKTAPTPPSSSGNTPQVKTTTVGTSDAAWVIYQVLGSPELIGATQVTVQTSIPWKRDVKPARTSDPQVPANNSANGTAASNRANASGNALAGAPSAAEDLATDVVVPLIQLLLPSGATHLHQDWTLHTDLQVETLLKTEGPDVADAWLAGQRERPLSQHQHAIELKLQPRLLQGAGPVRIDKCWLQSFVGGGKRRERFVVHVESNANELRLKLPREAIIREGKVKVSVNGFAERLFGYDQQTDVVTIPLGDSAAEGQVAGHVVEVSYFLPNELSWVTTLNVSPPEILGAEQIEQFYWQLLTPAVQHLGWSPNPLTAEWTWQWSGLWWNRNSRLGQRELEDWIGAVDQEPPPASANSYVMSGRGMERTMRVYVLSRFILWFPIGLLAIACAFLALNFAMVRKPVVVLALAAGIASLATLWPDLAVLAGQTAVISLGLVALVWVVQAGVDSRVRRRSVFSARPSTYLDRSDQVSVSRSARPAATQPPQPTSLGSSAGHHGG